MGRKRWWAIATALVLQVIWVDQVIAASQPIDQPAEYTESLPPHQVIEDSVEVVPASPQFSGIDLMLLGIAVLVVIGFFRSRSHRLERAASAALPFTPLMAILLVLGFLIMARLGVALSAYIFQIEATRDVLTLTLQQQAQLALGVYLAQAVMLASYIRLQAPHRSEARAAVSTPRAIAIGSATTLLAWPVVASTGTIAALILWLVRREAAEPIAHQTLSLFLESNVSGWYLLLVGLVVVAAPVMEEVIYRGLVQNALIDAIGPGRSRWIAVSITSAVFVLMHVAVVQPHALGALFVLSLAFGWVYIKTGRLAAPITMHILFNAGNFALALLTER